ncbi:MAG: sigma-54-dependent Fis family transcriptional regulator [Candidatus Dadabacteria bacterium]|nr:MAG: sigma-54-dependent Fis family transcriptional regulator [Candidatus Dadabacteria bacterium]
MEKPEGESIRVLAVDDNPEGLFALESILEKEGYEVTTASDGKSALKLAAQQRPDLILLDVMMPGLNGFEVTEQIKLDPVLRFIPVVLLTSRDGLDDIVDGFSRGADDYIRKPYKPEELLARIKAALRTRQLYRELNSVSSENDNLRARLGTDGGIIGESDKIKEIFTVIERVKDADVPVLITGESGTGKELVATALHRQSRRAAKPFIVVNCSAFNENLLESELFGHVRGAFTGANTNRQGLFEVADGGTFFLDEVGDMSSALQVKLLRVLQDGSFMPVGSSTTRKANVRIVAATNRNLKEMITTGEFREDLFYRISVVNIELPPLRERKEDVPLLLEHFLLYFSKKQGMPPKSLSAEAEKLLINYDWPGNIRELQNEIERLVIMSGADQVIDVDYLSAHIVGSKSLALAARPKSSKLKEAIEDLERQMILEALRRLGGNKSEAARELGISRSSLISKVQTYGLE